MPDIGCSPSAAHAFGFLIDRGLADFQAAGVVGNLQQESGFNPNAVGDGGLARGIAQWHEPRWGALLAFATSRGLDPQSLDTQLEFLWHELTTEPKWGLSQILASTTTEEATVAFQDLFERCGDCRTESRIALAKSALYACPAVRPPDEKPFGAAATAVVVTALVAAAWFGAKALKSRRTPEPEPEPFRYTLPDSEPEP